MGGLESKMGKVTEQKIKAIIIWPSDETWCHALTLMRKFIMR